MFSSSNSCVSKTKFPTPWPKIFRETRWNTSSSPVSPPRRMSASCKSFWSPISLTTIGCGTFGRTVHSDSRGLGFQSSHRQLLMIICLLFVEETKILKKSKFLMASYLKKPLPPCGYGRRLMSKGHGFESRHHILDGHDIFYIDLM